MTLEPLSGLQHPGLGIQDLYHEAIASKRLLIFVACKEVKFQKCSNFPGNTKFNRLLLDLLKIKLNVHIKAMWFITFFTKHPICKTSLCLSRCLIKVKTKTLQVYLSEFCNHSRLLFIALHSQVIKVN